MAKVQVNSDLRQLIDGKQAVTIDKAAKQYVANKAIESDTKTKLAEDSEIIKTLGVGKFETSNFTIDIEYREGSMSIDKDALRVLYPEIFTDERLWKKSKDAVVLKSVKAKV